MGGTVRYASRLSMFRAALRTSRSHGVRTLSTSARTCTPAAKKARPSPCKRPADRELETSFNQFCHTTQAETRPIGSVCRVAHKTTVPSRAGGEGEEETPSLSLGFLPVTSVTILLNSASGFSSFTRSSDLRAFSTQSYFTATELSSALLNLNVSLNSRFARFRS